MSDELINEYFDISAATQQTEQLLVQIKRAKDAYIDLSKTKKSLQTTTTFSDSSKLAIQAEKESQAAIKTQKELIALKKQQVQLENELLRQSKLQSQEAAAALKAQKSAGGGVVSVTNLPDITTLKQTGEVVNELDKAQAAAAISATAFGNSQNKSTAYSKLAVKEDQELVKAREALVKANSKANVEMQGFNIQKSLANKAAKEEALLALGLLSPYQLLTKQYNSAAANAKDLAVQFGVNSIQAKAAAKEAFALNTQLQTIDKTVGQSQKNVGNYGSAFGKILGPFRQIANILPGIGLSGIFLLGFEAISRAAEGLGIFSSRLSDAAVKRKVLADVEESASKIAGKEAANLAILRAEIESTSVPMAKRLQAIKDLKKEFPDYFADLTNEQLLTGNVANAYDLATAAILRKARASAAAAELEKVAAEKFAILQRSEDRKREADEAIRLAKARTVKGSFSSATGGGLEESASKAQVQKEIRDRANAQQKADQEELDRLNKKQAFLLQFAIEGANEIIKLDKQTSKSVSDNRKKLSDAVSTSFEQFKIEQERYLDLINEAVNDENRTFEERIRQLQHYTYQRKVLINAQEENEKQAILSKLANDVANLEKEKKKGADIKGIEKEIEIITFNANEQLKLIEKKAQDARLRANDDFYKRKQKMADDYAKEALKKAKEDAKDQAAVNASGEADMTAELEKKRNKIKAFLETIQGYYDKVRGVIAGALNIGFTKRKNDIQDAIDAIDRQKEADLAANDARVQSEQDKAANIAIINNRAEQKKEQQRQKQKQIDRQQAQAEKALAIFQITLSIAKAVASHLGKPWLIAADLVLGAAELAIAIATPIPRFFKGKKRGQAYEGLGMINDHPDGRTMEVIERADGSIDMPGGRNVITHVDKDDIIHPDRNAWLNAILGAAHRDAMLGVPITGKTDTGIMSAMMLQTKLLKQIANKPVSKTYATDKGLVQVIHYGSSQIKYENENLQW